MKKSSILLTILGTTLIVFGLSVFAYSRTIAQQGTSPIVQPSQKTAQAPQNAQRVEAIVYDKPRLLIIPRLGLTLPVIDGLYNPATKQWNVSNTAVQYATITTPANNNSGNTFIYGHNFPGLLKRLPELQVGDEIMLVTEKGYWFTYRHTSRKETNPLDDSLFYYSGPPIVTMQTCSGVFDQNRLLLTFGLVKVEKS